MKIADERVYQAVEALRRGWRVIPLQGKRPVLAGWQHAERPDEAQVRAWAEAGNYGVVTGEPGGAVVLDVDDSKYIESMMAKYPTVTALTGRGCHLYFRTPAVPVKNAVGLAEGVDFRGGGGQVVGVGSVHPEHGGIYRWAPGRAPGEVALAELPPHILDRLRKDKPAATAEPVHELPDDVDPETIDIYYRTALADEVRTLRNAGAGGRNHALNKAAFNLGQLVAGGHLPRALVAAKLMEACAFNGLLDEDGEWQCQKSIESGLSAGSASPREPRPVKGKSEPEAKVDTSQVVVTDLADPTLEAHEPEWYVPNLVLKYGMHLIWAQPGGYKTRMTVRILLELLTHEATDESHTLMGNPDWNVIDRLGRVLLVTTEENANELRFVMNTVEAGWYRRLIDRNRLVHVYAHQLNLDKPLTLDDLPAILDAQGHFDMVVLDSLTGLRPKDAGTQWDVDNEAANVMCLRLRRMLAERRMSLWIIHHSDKLVKNYRGPTEWWASTDVMFGLLAHYDKDSEKNLVKVLPQKVRGGRVLPVSFIEPVWTNGEGKLKLNLQHFKKGGTLDAKLQNILEQLDRHAKGDAGLARNALAEVLGMQAKTLQGHLDRLVDLSEVEVYTNEDLKHPALYVRRVR